MRLGIALGEYGPHASRERIIHLATSADRHGLDSVWCSDRIVVPARVETPYPYSRSTAYDPYQAQCSFEPLVTMAVVAGCTANVRIGVSVLALAAREPLLLAKQLATLDNLSAGRVVAGVGLGWLHEEFDLVAPGAWERRVALTDDFLALFPRLWNEDGPVAFEGTAYSCEPLLFQPKPSQQPRIPVEVGGNSAAARRRAVRAGDAWHAMQLSPADIEFGTAQIRAEEARLGRAAGSVGVTVRCSLVPLGDYEGDDTWRVPASRTGVAAAVEAYAAAGADTIVFDLDPTVDGDAAVDVIGLLAEHSIR
jgi:probable F420-dependent oxidoreductase